jgi:pterin-4a-carbinolamine dehydratase
MLNSFLKDIYITKVVTREFVNNHLKTWKATESHLSKTFTFQDFNHAVAFVSLAGDFLKTHQIEAKM